MGAAATLDNTALTVECGQSVDLTVTIRNTGKVVDLLTVLVLGDPGAWCTVEPPTTSLFPGAEGTVTLTFKPPRDPRTPFGTLPFGVRVIPKEDPAGAVVEEGTIEVKPFVELNAEVVPRTSKGYRRSVHEIAVDNRGNAAVEVSYEAMDPDGALDLRVFPPRQMAPPGTATIAQVYVETRDTLWRGSPKTLPFNVSVTPTPAAGIPVPEQPIALTANLEQAPIVPPWLLRTLAGAFALILASVLVWKLVLKPQVKQVAQQAVAAPIAQVDSNVRKVADQVGVDLPGGSSKPGLPGQKASASPGAGDSALGAPTSGRLHILDGPDQNAPKQLSNGQAFPLPRGRALTVSSVVLQNAYGDTGLMEIGLVPAPGPEGGPVDEIADDKVVLQIALADVKGQTITFSPPIVVPPGMTLGAVVICTQPGVALKAGAAAEGDPRRSTCDESVLVSGYIRSSTAATPSRSASATPSLSPSPS